VGYRSPTRKRGRSGWPTSLARFEVALFPLLAG
jgi:hypothetical protein